MNGFGNQSGGSLFGQNTSQSGGLFGSGSTAGAFGSAQPAQSVGLGAASAGPVSSAPKRTQSVGGIFGSAGAGSSATNTGGLFGSSTATNNNSTGTGLFGSTTGANSGSAGLFGGTASSNNANPGLNKPVASTGFGSTSAPANSGLFGQNSQQPSTSGQASGGLFGSNNQQSQSGGLFGQQNQQSSGGGLFGKSQAGGSGLFGSSKPATGTGGLFGGLNQGQNQGQQPQTQQTQGLFGSATTGSAQPSSAGLLGNSSTTNPATNTGSLFGNASSTGTSGGLFGRSSNTGGSVLGGNGSSSGGLFGGSSQPSLSSTGTGGLFGSTNVANGPFGSKPTGSTGLFGSVQQAQAAPQQQLHTSIDQASYILQGVSPSQKLYTSLTQPAQKRTAHEAHGYAGYASKHTFRTPTKDRESLSKFHIDAPDASPVIPGPSKLATIERNGVISTSTAHGEPRQWVNSYDKFLKERPTTLVIKRDSHHHKALLSPPVSTAPPPIASIAGETSVNGSKLARDTTLADRSTAPIEPDVSLFHRQANNMTVVQVSKKALQEGYYIFPRIESLSAMSKSQLSAVSNLIVGREQFGQIEYPGTVDLSRVSNLGDILGTLVVFEAGTVCVYPDEESKALPGHELNLPCTVTIENAWPIDAVTRKKITDMEDPRMQKHITRLREKCESDGGEFVTFAQGIWVFKVPHFSKWGLPAEDMIIDPDEDRLTTPETAEGSPFIIAADDQGGVSPVVNAAISDASNVDVGSILDADMSEVIENWQDQLSHATVSCYTASLESLTAASALPDNHDLEAVLLPNKPTDAGKQEGSQTASDKATSENAAVTQEVKSALQGPLRLDMLRRHVSKSPRDGSPLPLLRTKLEPKHLQTLSPHQEELWSLLSILYAPGGLNQDELSSWLEKKVSGQQQTSHDDVFDTIWDLLTTHKLGEATERSLNSNNPHLAVLISLFEDHNVVASDAEMQLRSWKETRSLSSVPPVVRRIWELAAGTAPAPAGLTWAQWLGMRLWYSQVSIEDAVSKVPTHLMNGAGPELLLLRQAIGSKPIKPVVEDLSLCDAFLFLQAFQAVSHIKSKQDLKCYDSICTSLARVLQDLGEANTAIYVALHINDSKQCFDVAHEILVRVSDSVSLAITQDLGVPEQLLDEARATHARNVEDYYSGAEYLLRAGLYEQAHQLIITDVAPQAVLDDKLQEIEDLLISLESKKDRLRRWSLGGEVYLQYLRAKKAGAALERYDVKALCNSCRFAQTPNLQSQAAIAKIAKWVSLTPFVASDFSTDIVLNMKLDPSQLRLTALQQASRLLK